MIVIILSDQINKRYLNSFYLYSIIYTQRLLHSNDLSYQNVIYVLKFTIYVMKPMYLIIQLFQTWGPY